MELYLNATKPPTLDIVPGSANFTIPGEVVVSVFMPDGTLQVAFVLGMVSMSVLTKPSCDLLIRLEPAIFKQFHLHTTFQVVYTDVSLAVVTRGSNQVVTANVTFLRCSGW